MFHTTGSGLWQGKETLNKMLEGAMDVEWVMHEAECMQANQSQSEAYVKRLSEEIENRSRRGTGWSCG